MMEDDKLLTLFLHLLFESLESTKVAKSGLLDLRSLNGLRCGLVALAVVGFLATLSLVGILRDAAVAEDDALVVFVKLDHLEVELLIKLSLSAIFLHEVLGSCEALYAVGERDNCALIHNLCDCTLVDRTNSEDSLEYIPRILFELLVAEAETTVVLIDLKNLNLDVVANLSELRRMFDLLSPREVGDVD